MENNLLVWVDTETTGLHRDAHLLELAIVVTDDWLRPVGDPFEVVIHHLEDHLDEMSEVVREMHDRSGLTGAVQKSNVTLQAAHEHALDFVHGHVGQAQVALLCGSSVWFDRNQLRQWMPTLDAYMFHRMIDVSSVKELARRWCPVAFGGLAAGMAGEVKTHRALPDVLNSIAELAYYRDTIFKV